MKNDDRSLFDRLDTIEDLVLTLAENDKKIMNKLENSNQNSLDKEPKNETTSTPHQYQKEDDQIKLKNFINSSIKFYTWYGTEKEFKRSKNIVNICSLVLIIIGIISTVFTSVSGELYGTYTLFENIWLIGVIFIFFRSLKSRKTMSDVEVKKSSPDIYYFDECIWANTNKGKKRYSWFRRISYFCIILNIIDILGSQMTLFSIPAIIFEVLFLGLSIALGIILTNHYSLYDFFALFIGRNVRSGEIVKLVYNIPIHKLYSYEYAKTQFKDIIEDIIIKI